MFSREDGSVRQHFSQDASNRPDVDRLCVALNDYYNVKLFPFIFVTSVLYKSYLRIKHNFGCSVPTSGDILCQETSMIVIRIGHSCKAKITNLQTDRVYTTQKKQELGQIAYLEITCSI